MPHHIERTIEPLFNILFSPCDQWSTLFKVNSTCITMDLSGEGFREGFQPFLSSVVQIYAALKS